MIVKQLFLMMLWLAGLTLTANAQPLCQVTVYDEEDGLPHGHVTQLLQDQQGFLWFATWNGLCRYDGYEFHTFKPTVGDGCHMATDRIRDISQLPDGQILCRVDDDYYLFDTRSYRFSDYPNDSAADDIKRNRQSLSLKSGKPVTWEDAFHTRWTLTCDGQLTYQSADGLQNYPLNLPLQALTFACTDCQGNLWVLGENGIYKLHTDIKRTERLDISPKAQVKCLFTDSHKRYWVATKEDETLRVYSGSNNRLLGYLGADGRLHQQYTHFGSAVYCMYESADGTFWIGTKPDGLYRLNETTDGVFQMAGFTQLPNTNVYNITEDRFGRLWVATLGGGLCYTQEPKVEHPRFVTPAHYPKDVAQRVRFLHLTNDNLLLAATTDGLLVTQVERDAENMRFYQHQREADRAESLSSSAIMDVVENRHGKVFISTESGGFNMIDRHELMDSLPTFIHENVKDRRLTNDVVLSLTLMPDERLMAVSNHLVTILDSTGQTRVLDARYFNGDYRFSDAHPQQLADGRWIFGLTDGAFVTSTSQMDYQAFQPKVVLTGVSVQGGSTNWSVVAADTLTLLPAERNITVHYAALDFNAADRISYSFRLISEDDSDSTRWNYVGHDRSVTLLDLEPGTYCLEIRSTNADGQSLQNVRRLTIVVRPTFWESTWGRLLIVLFVLGALFLIVYTLLYIRRIKRKQRETLAKYLKLMEHRNEPQKADVHPQNDALPDPMLERVMAFIEDHLSDSDVSVGDMAAAAATSRSGLQRKLKQAMGITPQDLLREARIKHASQLLTNTQKTIAEVAYACGFTDPKYFSRCFKQSTGQSPTEYKNAQ